MRHCTAQQRSDKVPAVSQTGLVPYGRMNCLFLLELNMDNHGAHKKMIFCTSAKSPHKTVNLFILLPGTLIVPEASHLHLCQFGGSVCGGEEGGKEPLAQQVQSLLHWLHHRGWSAGMGQCTIGGGGVGGEQPANLTIASLWSSVRACMSFSYSSVCKLSHRPEWDSLLSLIIHYLCHVTEGLSVS